MRLALFILIASLGPGCCIGQAHAGELPEILQRVLRSDTAYQSISCKIDIEVEVPGVHMPEKEIGLRLEKGKKPRIKSEGITFLPKHGIIGQYRDFLEVDCQAIPLITGEDTLIYKVVSLDPKTDWVTVDMTLGRADARIHAMLISTRKHGEYQVRHLYGENDEFFPEQTVVSFESMPLKLPLKFLGKQEGMEITGEDKGPVSGKIILRYSEISWEKAPT